MHNRKLKKWLTLWQKNNLIDENQAKNILTFMKERQKETFFRLLKWLMILGTFWLVAGIIATIINLFEINFIKEFFTNLWDFIYTWIVTPIHDAIIHPICAFIEKQFGRERHYFYFGIYSLILSLVLMFISSKIKPNKAIDNLNLTDEQKDVLKKNWVLDTMSSIFLAATFCCFNMLILPDGDIYGSEKILPIWNILGALCFVAMAYKFKKPIFLLFGIYFIALSSGLFFGVDFACYWVGVTKPILQILVGVILLLIGYRTQLKIELQEFKNENNHKDNHLYEKFARIYNWTGLLLIFIALWITSFWGFDFDGSRELQLLFGNILFIATSIGAMFYGAKTEQNVFFNYGLTFLIIETYTVFFVYCWESMPVGLACLILGAFLIGTGKIIQNVYIKKLVKKTIKENKHKD